MERAEVIKRLQVLARGEFQASSFFTELYGIDSTSFGILAKQVEKWAQSTRKRGFSQGTEFSRWVFETFLSHFGLLGPRSAALQIGMSLASFEKTVELARSMGVPEEAIGNPSILVRRDFVAKIHELFPPLQSMIFSDHTTYCRLIHEHLIEQGIEVDPQRDPAAKIVSPNDVDLSHECDIVTLEPIGLRYTVWVSFRKPIAFEPDKVSALTFIEHRDLLEPHIPDYFRADEEMLLMLPDFVVPWPPPRDEQGSHP